MAMKLNVVVCFR